MNLYQHQLEISEEIQGLIYRSNLAIVSLPERSGKTLTVIDAVENMNYKSPLWVTKKNAIDGIKKDLKAYGAKANYDVINYESVHKAIGKYDVIILDEFHTCSAYPKPSKRIKELHRFKGMPHILISATPAAESASQWFFPLWLTRHHFGEYKNFYGWAKDYVNVTQKRAGVHLVNDYTNAKTDKVMSHVAPFLIQRSREELGFEYHPSIEVHNVPLESDTIAKIKELKRHRVLGDFVADTPMMLINGLYQIECGTLKVDDRYLDLSNREIVNYIKDNFGDHDKVAIMCHWVGQREIMEREFKHASILSSTAHAEGYDLAHIDHLIIASMDYSTARFQQRNARQAAKHRDKPIVVHIITTNDGVSKAVYEAVAVKHVNFTARMALSA